MMSIVWFLLFFGGGFTWRITAYRCCCDHQCRVRTGAYTVFGDTSTPWLVVLWTSFAAMALLISWVPAPLYETVPEDLSPHAAVDVTDGT
jgi:hypothetical protein